MNAKQLIAVSALAFVGANAAIAQEATSDAWMKVASTKSRDEVRAEAHANGTRFTRDVYNVGA